MADGFTFQSYSDAIVTQIPSLPTDPNFARILPVAIQYSELTICKDLDLVSNHGMIDLGAATIGVETQAIPSGVVVVEQLYYGPSKLPVTPASLDYIKAVFAGAVVGPPRNFMVIGGATEPVVVGGPGVDPLEWTNPAMQIILGPAPDQAYALTGYGTERPATLSAANPTTFISTQLSDLFWSASMIFFSGYNRNFGAQSDQPAQAVSWKAEYDRLLKSAMVEEARKTFRSQAWVAEAPTMVAGARS
jgi:hypothetical protein